MSLPISETDSDTSPSGKRIITELPGPNARALLARDADVVSPSYPRDYPFVMSHGRGAEVWDVDGNRFLDFAAGIAVCGTGHCHPHVVKAIKDAADEFLHISSDYWHERQIALAERLTVLAPLDEAAMSFFCQSGTEAVEGALKLRHGNESEYTRSVAGGKRVFKPSDSRGRRTAPQRAPPWCRSNRR